jgi:hypothetical protein
MNLLPEGTEVNVPASEPPSPNPPDNHRKPPEMPRNGREGASQLLLPGVAVPRRPGDPRCPRRGLAGTFERAAPPPHWRGLYCAARGRWLKWIARPMDGDAPRHRKGGA